MFHEHASGLMVPENIARTRLVCTKDDWKRIDRAFEVFNRLGVRMQFKCEKSGCSQIVKSRTPDGGTLLRCDCTDRVFTLTF